MNLILKLLTTLILFSPCIHSQHNYSGNAVLNCHGTVQTDPSDSDPSDSDPFLYTCNAHFSFCQAFLIFTSTPPFNTVPNIAALTSSDQSELAKINNVSIFTVFQTNREVIVPVNCSCSDDGYYQSSTTYHIPTEGETYFTIANNTFQGLSTCASIKRANSYKNGSHELRVPLRCACPNSEQIGTGAKYLLTYSIGQGDTLYALSERFNVSVTAITEANSFSDEHQAIYPFTTILIPLTNEPASSHIVTRGYEMTELPLPLPTVPRSGSNTVLYTAGIAAGVLSLVIVLILVTIFLFHKKQTRAPPSRVGNIKQMASPEELMIEIEKFQRTLKVFTFSEIKKATRDFGSKNRIKGCVYRGAFKREVYAIKKGKNGNSNNEVKMLHQINHFNIVKLHGFCEHKENSYFVYEYMKNGSLKDWLVKKSGSHDLTHRIQIALDVANGLLYLHSFTSPAHVHNDITSSNILLDANLRAKIGNFSLARRANCDDMIRVGGRHGYVGPEGLGPGPVSPEVDVFAFGVVLLELITGKNPVFVEEGIERLLWMRVVDIMGGDNVENEMIRFIEPCVGENGGIECAFQVVKLGLRCLARDPGNRPNMVEVVSILLKVQSCIHKVVN